MADYSGGRKRSSARQHSIEDQALTQINQEAESRLTARRAARAEAREIRTRELERQQREEEEKEKEKEGKNVDSKKEKTSRYTRESSDESGDNDERDFKKELAELKDKYKKAMTSNAQLDNDKILLRYEVDLLTERVTDTEELCTELQRELKERTKDLEKKKSDFEDLETKYSHTAEQLGLRDALIEQHGLVFIQDEGNKEDGVDGRRLDSSAPSTALISTESVKVLESYSGSLDERLKKFSDERKMFEKQINKLKKELQEEREKNEQRSSRERFTPSRSSVSRYANIPNGGEASSDTQNNDNSELLKELSETRIRQKRAESEVVTLQGTIVRLESQMKRYKKEAENAEKIEEEFKTERRKWQKDLREAQTQKEDLEMQVNSLQKRLEKTKKK